MKNLKSGFAAKINEYMDFRHSLGFSDSHAYILKRFDSYCAQFHPQADILSKEVVRGWFDHELRRSDKDLRHRGDVLRSFAKYMGGDSYILPADLTAIPEKPYSPYIMDDRELSAFFGAVDSYRDGKDPFVHVTFSVLLRLIYSCGLRPGEGRTLRTEDIDLMTGEILIRENKCHKERIVVASDDMVELLEYYAGERSVWARPGSEEPFFIDCHARPISPWSLSRHVRKFWVDANPGVPAESLPRVRPYDLRHRFASELIQKWLDEGRDLYAMLPYMRSYMGHARFEDTAYYIHIIPDRLVSSPGVDWEAIDKIGLEDGIWEN